jgi:hypothetical protein
VQHPTKVNQTPFLDYIIREGWLYKLNQLCVPASKDGITLIKEVHASSYGGHFGSLKIVKHLQLYLFWSSMTCQVEHFIHACALCSQHKPANHKFGSYQPLPFPSHPWEFISMDFLSGLPMTLRKHDSIWFIVFRFSNMALFIPWNKTTIATQTTYLFFHNVWPHFGLPTSIIYDHDTHFLNTFWKKLWDSMGFQIKYFTDFHPPIDGQTEVVNRSPIHALHIQFLKTK